MAKFTAWPRRQRVFLTLGALAGVAVIGGLAGAGVFAKKPAPPVAAKPAAIIEPSRVDYRRMDTRIAQLMRRPDMVGLAVGTVERGRVRFLRGYGETLAGSGDPVTPDTVFRWASLSKGVASALVVMLAEEGRLSLDAPVASLGTTLTLPGDPNRATVADLLSHRLGLTHNAWDERLEAGEDPKMLRAKLGALPLGCPPGTCHAYQNIAFDAAAEIVERLDGQAYASAAGARLFAPLGMASATLGRAGLQSAPSWARPHHRGRAPAVVNDSYYRVPAAGGVNSSIRDLTRWMLAQMGAAPDVLSPSALELMHRGLVPTRPQGPRKPEDPQDARYGLGWRRHTYDGHSLVSHRGSVDGYASLILFDPVDRSGIVMLWNANYYAPARLSFEFFDDLYGAAPTDWLGLDEDSPQASAKSGPVVGK